MLPSKGRAIVCLARAGYKLVVVEVVEVGAVVQQG